MLVPLASTSTPSLATVGGKARALVELTGLGFNVPPGTILTTAFFAPWIAAVEQSEVWRSLAAAYGAAVRDPAEQGDIIPAADAVKQWAAALALDETQRRTLADIRGEFEGGSLAVRSSSPEEDLAEASFAGLYETVLDVSPADLEGAVRQCFLSCLDSRVLMYKLTMGFPSPAPVIAVVVQRMVASDTSGVAFSLNPLNNDFDEMLINAHRGLGEALVAGEITPDRFVLDKVTQTVIDERPASVDSGMCLRADEIRELCAAVARIESIYERPMDVEWAFAADGAGPDGSTSLYVLQARPITAYVPLAAELQTVPGEQRMLYIDRALTDGLTMSGAISPLTNDYVERGALAMLHYLFDLPDSADIVAGGFCMRGSRAYFNMSLYLHLMGRGDGLLRQIEQMDTFLADIFRSADIDRYRPEHPPDFLRIRRLIAYAPKALWRLRPVIGAVLRPLVSQRRFRRTYAQAQRDYDQWLGTAIDDEQALDESVLEAFIQFGLVSLRATAPAVVCFVYGGTDVVKKVIDQDDPRQVELADAMCRGYPDDLVVQMGLTMFDLAKRLPVAAFEDLDALAVQVERRDLPEQFLAAWDAFIERFGSRGPLEMELANPKYGEDPRLALQQIAAISASRDRFDPRVVQERLVNERERAFEELASMLSKGRRRRLGRAYRNILNHYDSREMIKHHLTQANERIRRRVLGIANRFVAEGRLDQPDHIFELTFADIQAAERDSGFDVRARVADRGAFYRQLKRQVRHFPHVIDSRGRILRPERGDDDVSTLNGTGVSPGVARGPVKVLNEPFEKPIEPGDVLVAVTTDPGWTPLFINAAAVLLEIGGELQHGALVAREFGKPCVTGIADVANRLRDGQIVEVDGAAGTVRVIDDSDRA